MCFDGDDASREIEQQNANRQALIQRGLANVNRAFSGFDQGFYDRQRAAVLAANLPQVGEQYRQQRSALGYGLAERGLLRSSASATLGGALERELAQQQRNVFNQATQATQALQQNVSTSKGNIISQLQQSADPTLAAQRSVEAATQFSAPSLLQPLGDLFSNWSNIYMARQVGKIYGQQQDRNSNRIPPPTSGAPSYGVK